MPTSGSDTAANSLMTSLTAGTTFTVPTVDLDDPVYDLPAATGPLYAAITRLDNDALTTGSISGSGTFDRLMAGFDAHLRREFESGRIAGADYAKAYIALTQAAMSNATQFLLGQEQAYWQAVAAQIQAQAQQVMMVTARVQLATAKAELQAKSYEVLNNQAVYALTKAKLATEDAGYGIAKFNLETLMPIQEDLLREQVETQRAQTSDTKSDGITPITGSMGKQKELYAQQITSYQRDAEVKATKIFSDAWVAMKTIDEGLLPPDAFANANLNTILGTLATNNGLT